ncbi:MAG TPA: inosine/xanthosine triphosphatase [Limnochorda sp.]
MRRPRQIAVGSTNPTKVEAAAAVAEAYFPGAEIIPVEVESGVRSQPLGQRETLEGARNRARRALEATGAELALGMEAGVALEGGTAFLMGWCVALDAEGRESAGCGLMMPLPLEVAARIRQGVELGQVMAERSGNPCIGREEGAVGLLTRGYVTRRQTWELACAYALAPFLERDQEEEGQGEG